MTMLANLAITTAVSNQVTTPVQMVEGNPESIAVQANFTYGSGGTSATAYVQTSLDGWTWIDIACFSFTTTSAKSVGNLSSETPVTTLYTPTDGSLANNTVKDGILGNLFRVKYTTVGTYAGNTSLRIDIVGRRRMTSLT